MRVGVSQRGATTFNRDPFLTLNHNFDTDEDNSTSSARSDNGFGDALRTWKIMGTVEGRGAKKAHEKFKTTNSMR